MLYDRKALKRSARQAMRESRPKVWVIALLFLALTVVAPSTLAGLAPSPSDAIMEAIIMDPRGFIEEPMSIFYVLQGGEILLGTFLGVVISLYKVVMGFGAGGYSLKVFRRRRTGCGDLFSAFPLAGKAIASSLLMFLFLFLWLLPPAFLVVAIIAALAILFTLRKIGLAVVVAGIVAVYVLWVIYVEWLTLRYALTVYFLMDHPDMGPLEAIRASKTAMRGNKWKRFVLELSFLGWDLLSVLIPVLIILLGGGIIVGAHYAAFVSGASLDPYYTILTAGLPFLVVICVAAAASMPLRMWLWGYENITFAGFYDTVTAPAPRPIPFDREEPSAPSRPHHSPEPPARPPVPPQSWDSRPNPPAGGQDPYNSPRPWENRRIPPGEEPEALPKPPAEGPLPPLKGPDSPEE